MPRLTTRDYKRPSRSSSVAKLREFALGVLVGAVLASAAFLIAGAHARHRAAAAAHAHAGAGSQSTAPHAPAPADSSSDGAAGGVAPAVPASSTPAAAAHAGAQPAQYDFYRMLPRLNVPVPREDQRPAHPPAAATAPPHAPSGGAAYLLQVGSYRSSAEADEVRARLARAGIAAQVERVAEGSKTWNRVRIGPLSDAELAKVREQLRTANIRALVIRADR